MKRIIVNIQIEVKQIPLREELLPKEQAKAATYKEQGYLEHLFFKEDERGVVLIFKDAEKEQVVAMIEDLPLFPYFEKVEYTPTMQAF